MPTGTLPSAGKKLWEEVYNKYKEELGEEDAAKRAWGAVRQAGWSKDGDGKWHKKSSVEFSMHIQKASYTQEHGMRWLATASDIYADKANDDMSLELYQDFIKHIEDKTMPPETYRSDFWMGGLPYVSLSHYPDLNGDAVPGMTEAVWIDGDVLKAKGNFSDTPLGRACYKAVKMDTSGPPHPSGPVRVSIAFLDYGHVHKSNGFVFTKVDDDDYCEECVREFLTQSGEGKRYIKGHLIHLAMTRVPMNERTSMIEEVEKSMTTRKEDALSIVEDEELIAPIEEKAKMVGKSDLVIKAKDEKYEEDEEDKDEPKGKKKDEKEDEMEEKSDVVADVVIPEPELPVIEPVGEIANQANLDAILSRLDIFDAITAKLDALTAEVAQVKSMVIAPVHPLDEIFDAFKSDYDQIKLSNMSADDKLHSVQPAFNRMGNEVANIIKSDVREEPKVEIDPTTDAIVRALSAAMNPVAEKLDMLLSKTSVQATQSQVPVRRSITPPVNLAQPVVQSKSQYSVKDILDKTT